MSQQQQQDALACEIHETRLQNFKGMNPDSNIVMLDFRNNQIDTFYGIPTLDNVQCMRFDDNNIASFLGMSFQPSLQVLTLLGNPITKNRHYRILAMLACGPSLREIDGAVITRAERQQCEACGGAESTLAQMVSLGWMSLDMGRIEGIKHEFMRFVSQRVDERRSFGVIAPDAAEVIPLATDGNGGNAVVNDNNIDTNLINQNNNGNASRSLLSPADENRNGNNNDRQVGRDERGNPIMGRDRGGGAGLDFGGASNNNNNNNDKNRPSNPGSAAHQLTLRDVDSLLRGPQQPHFGNNIIRNSSTSSSSSADMMKRETARYGAASLLNQDRAQQIFSVMQDERDGKVSSSNSVELGKKLVKAYSQIQQQAHQSSAHSSQGPSPMSPMNASPAGGNTRNHYLMNNNINGNNNQQQEVTSAELALTRSDITNLGSIELSHFDVSAQWQPPKNGTIQIVRGALRIEFDFVDDNNTIIGEGKKQQQSQPQPRLTILDDGGRIVSVFPLAVSRPDKHQSLWIHDGNPPAIALCSEHDGGVIDVVIMPSAESGNSTNNNNISAAKSRTLHKLLVHAMAAEHHHHQNNNNNSSTAQNSPPRDLSATQQDPSPGQSPGASTVGQGSPSPMAANAVSVL